MIQVDDWLERLIEENGDDMYRMKGVLSVSNSEQRYVFQVLINFVFVIFFPLDALSFLILIIVLLFFNFLAKGVHSILDGCPGKTWEPNEKRINKLVFIGRNLNETALRKGFKGCLREE